MAQVQCQIENPSGKAELTVGQVFQLDCRGDWPQLKKESLQLLLDKEDSYKLKLLSVKWVSENEARLEVTSYRVGAHDLKAVQLVDRESSVVLGDLRFSVVSVMDPKNPVKEPYGALGPLGLKLSIWYPLMLLLILAFLGAVIFYRWRARAQKKKLLAEMRLEEAAQEPHFQFYQLLRKLQRSYGFFSGQPVQPGQIETFVSEIDHAFKIYLARKFAVPTLKWNERMILSDLKRNHPRFHSEFRLEIRKALAELSRAKAAVEKDGSEAEKLTEKDCQQLLDLLRKQVDQIENWHKMKGRGK